MSGEKKEKPAVKPETKAEKKTTETVHLSAEELRRISGGVKTGGNPKNPAG